jgi:hypothetical protein
LLKLSMDRNSTPPSYCIPAPIRLSLRLVGHFFQNLSFVKFTLSDQHGFEAFDVPGAVVNVTPSDQLYAIVPAPEHGRASVAGESLAACSTNKLQSQVITPMTATINRLKADIMAEKDKRAEDVRKERQQKAKAKAKAEELETKLSGVRGEVERTFESRLEKLEKMWSREKEERVKAEEASKHALAAEIEERERALAAEREERERALAAEREERERALAAEREERERALKEQGVAHAKREDEQKHALAAEIEERERALAAEREERERALKEQGVAHAKREDELAQKLKDLSEALTCAVLRNVSHCLIPCYVACASSLGYIPSELHSSAHSTDPGGA